MPQIMFCEIEDDTENNSSVLGYPAETSKAFSADHYGLCKYHDPRDPNYVTVGNALQSLGSKNIATSRSNEPPSSDQRESHGMKGLLAITELPDVDYIFLRDLQIPGTNDWFWKWKGYLEWLRVHEFIPSLLWLKDGAATGKSVMFLFVVDSVVEQGVSYQYPFP